MQSKRKRKAIILAFLGTDVPSSQHTHRCGTDGECFRASRAATRHRVHRHTCSQVNEVSRPFHRRKIATCAGYISIGSILQMVSSSSKPIISYPWRRTSSLKLSCLRKYLLSSKKL